MTYNLKGDALLTFLRECAQRDDRAAFANLRCVLRKNLKHRAWPLLASFGGIEDEFKEYDHDAKVVQTIAGLYATHPPKGRPQGDFGSACHRLMSEDELKNLNKPKGVGPVGRRFQHLLASEPEEICERVIRFVLRLKAAEIPVNYAELHDALLFWGDKKKNRWAGSFWNVSELEEAAV